MLSGSSAEADRMNQHTKIVIVCPEGMEQRIKKETMRHFPHCLTIGPDTLLPEEAAGKEIILIPFKQSLPSAELVNEALAAHRATGADITVPDRNWLGDTDFTIYRRGITSSGAPLPDAKGLDHCSLHSFVPSWRLMAKMNGALQDILKRPRGVHLSLSEKCTLGCRMCPFYGCDIPAEHRPYYRSYMERRSRHSFITPEAFSSFVKLLRSMQPIEAISLFGPGEPFLNPNLEEILGWCTRQGISLNFTTNGNFIQPSHLTALSRATVSNITLSADAATAGTYGMIKPGAQWEKLVEVAQRLRDLQEKGATFRITASFIRQPLNQHEEEEFHFFWSQWADETVVTSRYHKGQPFYPAAWSPPERTPCASLINGIHVLTNGDCWACSAGVPDEFLLGNLDIHGPESVWREWHRHIKCYFSGGAAKKICEECKWWRQTQHCEEYRQGRLHAIVRPYSYKRIVSN